MAGQSLPTPPAGGGGGNIGDLSGTADTTPYTDGAGDVQEVGLGPAGTVLVSQGTGSAPTYESRASVGLALALGG